MSTRVSLGLLALCAAMLAGVVAQRGDGNARQSVEEAGLLSAIDTVAFSSPDLASLDDGIVGPSPNEVERVVYYAMDPKPCAACLNELHGFTRAFSGYPCVEQVLWLRTQDARIARNSAHLMRVGIRVGYGAEPPDFPALITQDQVIGNLMMIVDPSLAQANRREIISTGMTSQAYKQAIGAKYFPCTQEA